MKLTRRLVLAVAATLTLSTPVLAQYPERPITLIVPWAAGGGTDATARTVASLLEQELGKPINVINRTGGGGIVGHTEIANAKPDGYTLGVITTELSLYHWLGTSPLDYRNYTPIALYNTDAQSINVRPDGPKDLKELLSRAKDKPGSLKASGANRGGAPHLAMAGLLNASQMPVDTVPWVPTDGITPALQLLTSNAIAVVGTTIPEVQAMVDAGEVKTLAIMRAERDPSFPNVPTVKEAAGVDWYLSSWRGIAGPKDLPADVAKRLSDAIAKVVEKPEFKSFMSARKFGMDYAGAQEFTKFLRDADERFGTATKAAGLAK
jgi:tripartite-type tricarboxylate transporter receptor subunit TctC